MYKIIGGDGNEYGPVDLAQIKQWIQDGRAGAQTKVQPEGATEWQILGEVPELAALLASGAPGGAPPTFSPTSVPGPGSGDALQMVQGPAIGLMVTAGLGLVMCALGIVMNLAGVTMGAMGGQQQSQDVPAWVNMMSGGLGIVSSLLGIIMSVVILLGALKMKKLENYTFAIIATVIAMVPCISPCCFVGLPIGIWALVVLNKPEVKGAFD
jgi:hypothetical protein